MSLAFVLDHRADLDPDGQAVADGSESLTNEQLLHRVRGASRHLRDLGVRPGDVVALKLSNRIEFVVLLFGAWRVGAAVTPINPSLTDGEVDRQLDDSGARLLVTEDSTTAHIGVATLAVGVSAKPPHLLRRDRARTADVLQRGADHLHHARGAPRRHRP
jgi:acyl-CoA synthetase (AMP-forming)/AMP-acid ligase II